MDTETLQQILAGIEARKEELTRKVRDLELQAGAVRRELEAQRPTGKVQIAAPPLALAQLSPQKNLGGRPRKVIQCSQAGCKEEHVARGLCGKHYAMARRQAKRGSRKSEDGSGLS